MKIARSLRALTLVALVIAFAFPDCARADVLDEVKQSKKIRIAIDLGVPPFGMTDDKMQPTGMDVETARLLAKDFGVELELVATTGASRIPSLQTGKADLVISTLSVTAERAKVIDFSFPYAAMRSVLAGTKSVGINSMADLDGKTVGTTRGTTHDAYLTQNAKNSKIVRYEDDATAAQAFASGQVDLFTTGELLLGPISQKNPSRELERKLVLETFKFAIGIRKGETRLLAAVNDWIRVNMKNGKLNEIYKKYYGNDIPESVVKDSE
jgi:polar amino acid transport system substrate-binding protein